MARRYLSGSLEEYIRPSVVTLDHLYAHNQHKVVLQDASFQVYDGQAVAIVGPKGVGKTLLLTSIQGQITPLGGHITLFGTPIPPITPPLQRQIGLMPAKIPLHDGVTIQDVVQTFANYHGTSLSLPQITRYLHRYTLLPAVPILHLAFLQQRLLALAIAVIHDPHLVLLDEPLAGLNEAECNIMDDYIRQLQREGRTLIVAFTLPIADKHLSGYDVVVRLEQGHLVPQARAKR